MNSVSKSDNRPFTVWIEGNVASGKSVFLNHFKKFSEICVLEEPLEKWTNFHGMNLLDLKFKSANMFQFPFQSYATLTRLRQHLQKTEKSVKMMERSLMSARHCFVESLFSNGLLHASCYHVLQEWYDYINEHHTIDCDLIIYLRTIPEVAYKRVKERARSEETSISLEYLQALHNRYENWLMHREFACPANVLIIDANQELDDFTKEYQRCEDIIKPHMASF